ncbi:hypothetical protein LPJ72_002773 [Coemansia sp. Benny D160-2]|nr:hypothetical protein LPJ72_002773 [Coemansia sp. Benny D160-2]
MDGQRNQSGSNFFSRIRNIDALKSPYPRHLAPGGRTPGAATGTRVVPASTAPHHSTARPSPVHPAALWQSPVPRSSDLATSPTHGVSSRLYGTGQVGLPPTSLYRPPAEYPNSVQPLRSRPRSYPDQRFAMPGSTLPTHIRTGNTALRGGIASNAQVCVLHRWFACIDIEKRAITVSGSFAKPNGKTVLRHSTPIEQAHDGRILVASTGTIYQLASAADLDLMRANGFPEYLIPYFVDGFPRDWRQLVEGYIVSTTSSGRNPTASSTRRGDGVSRLGFTPVQRRDSYDSTHGRLSIDRIGTITEGDESLFESQSPISPPGIGSSHSNSAGGYQTRMPVDSSSSPSYRGSVYRTGVDIFAQGRFAQTTPRRISDSVDIASSSTVGGPAYFEANESADDTFTVLDKYESEEEISKEHTLDDNETPSHHSLGDEEKAGEQSDDGVSTQSTGDGTVHRLGGALDSMRVEKELSVSRTLSSDDADDLVSEDTSTPANKRRQQCADQNSDNGKENNASAAKGSVVVVVNEGPNDSVKRRARRTKLQSPSTKKESVRRVIETSDDSCQQSAVDASGDSDDEVLSARARPSAASRTPTNSRRILGQRPATATRATRRATLAETPTKPSSKLKHPSSAPPNRVKAAVSGSGGGRIVDRRQGRAASARRKSSVEKTDNPEDSDSDFASSEKRAIPDAEDWSIAANSNPPNEESGDDDSSVSRTAKVILSEEPSTPTKAAKDDPAIGLNKTPSDMSMTTPKRKKGRNYFRYKEMPGPSISVTRSGRKINRPKEWWANAQEHLSSSHKESDLKYKWGTGDPVLVKGGKRVRLSDFYMQGGGAGLSAGHQSEGSADESDGAADRSDGGLAATANDA